MLNIFWQSLRLKIAYRINTILYSLKQIPFVKKLLPASLYANRFLKSFALILSILWEIISVPLFKGMYLFIMVKLPIIFYPIPFSQTATAFAHILLFLTIAGAVSNSGVFDPTKDKYYAIIQMRMNAKSFTLMNYTYEMLKIIIGMGISLLLLIRHTTLPVLFILFVPFSVCSAKTISVWWSLHCFKSKKLVRNENSPVKAVWFTIGICYLLAYGGIILKTFIPLPIVYVIGTVCMLLAIGGIQYMYKFDLYRQLYQILLSKSTSSINVSIKQITNESYLKTIDTNTKITSTKKGYEYFHEIFIRRHQKLLWHSAKKIAMISLAGFLIAISAVILFPEIRKPINQLLLVFLPYFVFIIYSFNSGKSVVQAMFRNCDHSMLTYSFYRRPDVILSLFKLRLRDVIRINLLPASVIAIGLPVLLYVSGGTSNPFLYLVIFACILATSTFFSIHYLTCYYLLQPYNEDTEAKSSTYNIVMSITYLICFGFIYLKMDTFIFGTIMIIFCIAYAIVSMLLIYKMAYKTFRLRR